MKKQTTYRDLKVGDKFYYMFDAIIYVVYQIDIIDDNNIKLGLRQFKTRKFVTYTISSPKIADYPVAMYNSSRNKESFRAGFIRAIAICREHMTAAQLEDAGLVHDVNVFLASTMQYQLWLINADGK